MRSDFIDLLRVARSNGIDVSYNTNGIRQDDALIDAIFDLNIAQVTVSIDGVDETSNDAIRGKGTYAQAIQCLKKIADKKGHLGTRRPEIQIQMVVTRLWHQRIDLAFEMASGLGADALVISNIDMKGAAVSNASWMSLDPEEAFDVAGKILLGSMKHPELNIHSPIKPKVVEYFSEVTGLRLPASPFECKALKTRVNIFSDGTIAPCELALEQGMTDGLAMPKITEVDVEKGWHFDQFDRFANVAYGDPEVIYANYEPCNRCIYLHTICRPCPLLGIETAKMPLCLFADALLAESRELGGHNKISDSAKSSIIRAALEASGNLKT